MNTLVNHMVERQDTERLFKVVGPEELPSRFTRELAETRNFLKNFMSNLSYAYCYFEFLSILRNL
jgi:hypothetical protein